MISGDGPPTEIVPGAPPAGDQRYATPPPRSEGHADFREPKERQKHVWDHEPPIEKIAKHQAEEGQGLAEYGLILALIAVACIVAFTALGGGIAQAGAGCATH
jgi:pilus assembly protein Flp/PilA